MLQILIRRDQIGTLHHQIHAGVDQELARTVQRVAKADQMGAREPINRGRGVKIGAGVVQGPGRHDQEVARDHQKVVRRVQEVARGLQKVVRDHQEVAQDVQKAARGDQGASRRSQEAARTHQGQARVVQAGTGRGGPGRIPAHPWLFCFKNGVWVRCW